MSVIKLTQGDDLNALNEETNIVLDTDIDLTGFTAFFQLGDFRQEFKDITSKKLPLVIPAAESAKLPVGEMSGALKIYDATGLARTIAKDIKFLIEKQVVKNAERN